MDLQPGQHTTTHQLDFTLVNDQKGLKERRRAQNRIAQRNCRKRRATRQKEEAKTDTICAAPEFLFYQHEPPNSSLQTHSPKSQQILRDDSHKEHSTNHPECPNEDMDSPPAAKPAADTTPASPSGIGRLAGLDHSTFEMDFDMAMLDLIPQQECHIRHHVFTPPPQFQENDDIRHHIPPSTTHGVNTMTPRTVITVYPDIPPPPSRTSTPATNPCSRPPTMTTVTTTQGTTPLHLGSQTGHCNILSLLLQNGASVDSRDENGWTALHHAAHNGHADVVRLLLRWEADPMLLDGDGLSGLHLAVAAGHEAVVRLLVERGVDPNIRSSSRESMRAEG